MQSDWRWILPDRGNLTGSNEFKYSCSCRFLSVAGRRCENKGRRKRREESKEKKKKGSCTHTKFFMSILPVHLLSPQFA